MTRATRLRTEIVIVLGLSLGASAVYSIVSLIAALASDTSLANQSVALNPSRSTRQWLDATYQFLGPFFELFAVALALYLLSLNGRNPFRQIGCDRARPWWDVVIGWLLVAVVGVPGLALYAAGRALGITKAVEASSSISDWLWWTVPILVFRALVAALSEEIIVVGYLCTRLRELGVGWWATIIGAAILRGSYHLYQGIGPFVGNVIMGVLCGWCYRRWGRVMPLVIAHTLLDVLSFVGYPLAVAWWPAVFTASR
ncbi:MAG: CPBP family intramembrane metalloprotease domain-containing protein [Candidatus Lumbricidophila eiseniae]|uniref:CPBP family intramembrane metalloprotease domain-containing protein n=1 Tax=Candidatus Lumbricidiphila eiseniae TaxID=1969409 RepID=A0A2A6FR23_9MICO|nr:MAG: CPBP family intramembrane metalloprotease domain-containing protein [Candidatus Lumbricidophila eiseniae]